MKTGTSHTGELISGLPYLRQRLFDGVITPKGSLVGARDYGSNWYKLQDRNVDGDFYMDSYVTLSDAINNPANGLDDFLLETMAIEIISDRKIDLSFSGQLLNNGEPVTINNIVIPR